MLPRILRLGFAGRPLAAGTEQYSSDSFCGERDEMLGKPKYEWKAGVLLEAGRMVRSPLLLSWLLA